MVNKSKHTCLSWQSLSKVTVEQGLCTGEIAPKANDFNVVHREAV